jgi:hypothetical protein
MPKDSFREHIIKNSVILPDFFNEITKELATDCRNVIYVLKVLCNHYI